MKNDYLDIVNKILKDRSDNTTIDFKRGRVYGANNKAEEDVILYCIEKEFEGIYELFKKSNYWNNKL